MHKIVKKEKNKTGIKKLLVTGAIIISLLVANIDNRPSEQKANEYQNLILSSTYLTEEEKSLLINEDLFLDIASSNNSRLQDIILKIKLNNLQIEEYTDKDLERTDLLSSDGYYQLISPNVLHIKGYSDKTTSELADVITHEFMHLLQLKGGYTYINEAAAEILSNEYYGSPIESYKQEIIRVKVLMELIGSDCIWRYLESSDGLSLPISLLNYLSLEDTVSFLKLLTTTPNASNKSFNREQLNRQIDYYLAKIYLNKYGVDISNDLLIQAIYEGKEVNRKYFNTERRTSNDYRTFALKKDMAIKKGYDINNPSDEYTIVIVLDDYVIIEEKTKELQLNLTQN